jgi:hypothetical protein
MNIRALAASTPFRTLNRVSDTIHWRHGDYKGGFEDDRNSERLNYGLSPVNALTSDSC